MILEISGNSIFKEEPIMPQETNDGITNYFCMSSEFTSVNLAFLSTILWSLKDWRQVWYMTNMNQIMWFDFDENSKYNILSANQRLLYDIVLWGFLHFFED